MRQSLWVRWLSLMIAMLALCAAGMAAQVNGQQNGDEREAQSAVSAALANVLAQQAKLTPSDGVHLGFFSASVAISGNTVAIGMADTSLPGAVYIFEKPSSGWGNMTQTARLTASDGAANDYLGYSVAISGDTVIAGAPNANQYQGSAYVFVKPVSGWANATETAKLGVSGGHSTVGNSVAISGNTVVVGAPDNSSGGVGAAFVYVEPASGWTNMNQTAKLTPSDGYSYFAFGTSVAMSGNTVVATAVESEKLYVFVKPAAGWANMKQTAQLGVSAGSAGTAVAIDADSVVSGSPYAMISGKSEQGAAYVFVKPSTGWTNMKPTAMLTASDGAAGNQFGYSVAISGNRILTGSPFAPEGSNSAQGAAYTYIRPVSGWKTTSEFNAKVIASDGGADDELGWSVSLSGITVLAGAPGATSQRGAAYIF